MNCTCEFCSKKATPSQIANGGIYTVIKNPSNIKGHDNVWGVAGPYRHAAHACATWHCKSEAEAKEMAEKMNGGWMPPEDDL